MRALRWLLVALVALAGLITPQLNGLEAQARAKENSIGYIQGVYYRVSEGGPLYSGVKDLNISGHCVDVQRKTVSTGEWTTSGVYNYRDCQTGATPTDWAIRNPDYISNTAGIRLIDVGTKVTLTLCYPKTDCLAM